jgi:hypothetical protein
MDEGIWTRRTMHMQTQHPWMDSINHVVSSGRWHVMSILMVEKK